jgi:Fe-S cluster assembly protein SufD
MDSLLDGRAELRLAAAGVGWVKKLRDSAAASFAEHGLPSTRDEDWKYTNVKPIAKRQFRPAGSSDEGVNAAAVAGCAIEGLSCHRAVFVNGYFSPPLSDLSALPPGVVLDSLARTLAERPQDLSAALGRVMPAESHGFTSLNTAYLTDGAYLRVPEGVVVEHPIDLLFINTAIDPAPVVQPRNLIVMEPSSSASVLERYVGVGNGSYLTNAVTELSVRANASIEHYKLQEESVQAYHVGGLFINLERDARVTSHNVAVGGAIARTDLRAVLAAEGAHCEMNGLYLGNGRQHLDNHTQIDHARPRCTSDEYYKGVLDDRARAVFHGRIVVQQDAQQTDAQQQNRNLLLSPDAEIDTKPQLEIYADDVKCSHGATVGQLDSDSLFYLRSRAIDERTARLLLTYAFANDVIGRCALKPVRERLEQTLTRKLFHARDLEELV